MFQKLKEKLGILKSYPENKGLNPQLEQLERALKEDDPRVSEKAEALKEAINE